MPIISETAYPRLKNNLTSRELAEIYTPSLEELNFAKQHTRSTATTVGLLILLKTFQRLGYPIFISEAPVAVTQHIVKWTQLSVSSEALTAYDKSRIRRKHSELIRDYLGLKAWGASAQQVMN